MDMSVFYKLFPPPSLMLMTYAGLDISDDAIRSITYHNPLSDRRIKTFHSQTLPSSLLNGGDTTDIEALKKELIKFRDKSGIHYVKVSIPEEKAYLFQMEVPTLDVASVRQNIESRLEDNVPLTAKDAIFHFDLLPDTENKKENGKVNVSVSVVPKTYIEKMLEILHSVDIIPVAFEVVPKALAHLITPMRSDKTAMIVNIMDKKIGVYVVTSGTVSFASTIERQMNINKKEHDNATEDAIAKEVLRIYEYWISRHDAVSIHDVVLVGSGANLYVDSVKEILAKQGLNIYVPNLMENIVSNRGYIPPIAKKDLASYAVSMGLALI
jgi:Tfp pilus assembly PilM family ATPase